MSTIGRQDTAGVNPGFKKSPGDPAKKSGARPKPGLADFIAGESKSFVSDLQPYLPQELVGGAIPHVVGMEDEGVWNAASQACATEKVHFVYSVEGGRVWYLACPSSALASNPDSWCPLAAALPGNSEHWDKETVYLYEHEGIASALRWDQETGRMQVFLGAARTILPRIQTMDANFVTINPKVADTVPWKNTNLKTEKLARGVARSLVFSGVLVCLASVLLLVMSYIATNVVSRDLSSVKQQSEEASNTLMIKAYNAMQSDAIRHMVNIQTLLDRLAKVDGTLVKYEVSSGKLEWQALIPPAFGQEFGTPKGLEQDGRVRVVNNK